MIFLSEFGAFASMRDMEATLPKKCEAHVVAYYNAKKEAKELAIKLCELKRRLAFKWRENDYW